MGYHVGWSLIECKRLIRFLKGQPPVASSDISIGTLVLGNGRNVTLAPGAVLAVVGPNNSGKTHFLRSILSHLHGREMQGVRVGDAAIEGLEIRWNNGEDAGANKLLEIAQNHFSFRNEVYSPSEGHLYPEWRMLSPQKIRSIPSRSKTTSLGPFARYICEFDDAIERVGEADLQKLRTYKGHEAVSLAQLARDNPSAMEKIQKYFFQIFHEEISFYDRGYGELGLLLAPANPKASGIGEAMSQSTAEYLDTQPKMWLQGLGMRSVLGLLLRLFAGERKIFLIDEPEAFLHPPQAKALGTVLAGVAHELGIQIILATHDRNILIGLTDSENAQLAIERISRSDNGSSCLRGISPSVLSDVRGRSLIRYSPLFDSLFTQATVLVENEKDAYFYSESLSVYFDDSSSGISVDDFLFLSTGGTGAVAGTVDLARKLHSTVVAVCDFDILARERQVRSVVEALGGQFDGEIERLYSNAYAAVVGSERSDQKKVDKAFKRAKGACGGSEEQRRVVTELLSALDKIGLVLCHVGELEDFDPAVAAAGPKVEWVQRALRKNVHRGNDAQHLAARILRASGNLPSN